jgi:hypothetical protein
MARAICVFYAKGECKFGPKCRSDHAPVDEARKSGSCTYFLVGACTRGDKCKFKHGGGGGGGGGASAGASRRPSLEGKLSADVLVEPMSKAGMGGGGGGGGGSSSHRGGRPHHPPGRGEPRADRTRETVDTSSCIEVVSLAGDISVMVPLKDPGTTTVCDLMCTLQAALGRVAPMKEALHRGGVLIKVRW